MAESTYENMLLCNNLDEITGFSHTVVRIFCPVVIILSLAHVAFKKVMLMLCRTCFCKNVQALKYQSVGTVLQYFYRTVDRGSRLNPRSARKVAWVSGFYYSRGILRLREKLKLFVNKLGLSEVRLAQPNTSPVRQRTGLVCKRLLPSPSPPSSFFFWLSPHFPRRQNTENPVPRYLGLSLLLNSTETLATQANVYRFQWRWRRWIWRCCPFGS